MESSPFKSWMIANLKFWGFIPVFLIWALVLWIATSVTSLTLEDSIWVYALMPAILTSALFSTCQEVSAPGMTYFVICIAPILFLIAVHMGKIELDILTTGLTVWLWISVFLGLLVGSGIAFFTFQNIDDLQSSLFCFSSSAVERFSSTMLFTFMRFTEGFIFSFFCFAAFGVFFL